MWAIYFFIGFFAAIGISQIYFQYVRIKSKKMLENQQTIFQLVEGSKDVIYHFDVKPGIKFRYISPSLDKFLGPGTIKEAFERPDAPFERIHPVDYDNLCKKISGKLDYNQILIQRWKDNEGIYRCFEEFVTPIYDKGQIVAVQGIMRNIDEKIKLQQDLEYRIYHDALTGIYNREYFENIFTKYDEEINSPIAIILCDLDELKSTNDNFGHKKGDALIKAAAELLNQFSSETITVARIGGDEFVLLIENKDEIDIEQMVNDILKEIDRYNDRRSEQLIKMSIGYSLSSYSLGHISEVFSEADKNMYKDKVRRKQLIVERTE
ncbi:sensor domain-containing diguanylate cyclase [Neobacillus mesonae]|uniref:sensor domain-containing diguanylate cyclase n=1 Tax=Neobacillus mesonae TaxID=1193713 RepID=UPI002E1C8638|nr:sensor domain-containing diguanylate cyclase [Neobacillus mesonae]